MGHKSLHWVNSPVLFQAIMRYEQGLLPGAMKLWVEQLLELKLHDKTKLLKGNEHLEKNF